MIRTGRVITIENNRPMVCFDRLDACEKCGACYNNKKQTLVRVLGQAEIGNIVDVALPDNRILTLSVIMYVILNAVKDLVCRLRLVILSNGKRCTS